MNATAPFFGQENATAIAAVCQVITPRPPRAALAEDGQVTDLRIVFPALGFDAASLVFAQRDQVLFAAGATDMAVPVLHNGEMTHGQGHVWETENETLISSKLLFYERCLLVCHRFVTENPLVLAIAKQIV